MKFIKRFETLSGQTDYLNSADIDTYVGYVDENHTVYYDDALPKPLPFEEQYLTFVAEADNMSVKLRYAPSSVFQYSVDNGATWVTLPNNESTSSVNTGEKILFKASGTNPNYYMLTPSVNARVQGNIMSLVYGDNFIGQTTIENTNQFRMLFSDSYNLTSAENLILPATTLANGCYSSMFKGCTNLTTAPELPATTLASNCYSEMFRGCTNLATAPELPATTLTGSCYSSMFNSCTSLTTAPELSATTLAEACYSFMFNGCSNLNYIKCLATNISAWACTNGWVSGVASTGTFVKAASMNNWTTGNNGIPTGWTIENI